MIITLQTLVYLRESLMRTLDRILRPYYSTLALTFGQKDSVSEDDECDEQVFGYFDDEKGVAFFPPMYLQRYAAVTDCLMDERWRGQLEKVVDLGYHDMSFIKYLKEVPGVKCILGVDIESIPLRCSSGLIGDGNIDNDIKNPLQVTLFEGNAADPDYRLIGCDAVVAIEMIEHMLPHDLDRLVHTVFGFVRPRVAIFTTPNGDFNVLFKTLEKNGFRRWDHFFEWSREQFNDWCSNIVARYPEYDVTCKGIGPGPPGTLHLGCCSQMAVFSAKQYYKQKDLDINSLALVANKPQNVDDLISSWDTLSPSESKMICDDVASSDSYSDISRNVTIMLTPAVPFEPVQYEDKMSQCNLELENEKNYLMFDYNMSCFTTLFPRKMLEKVYVIEDVASRLNCTTLLADKFSKATSNMMAMDNLDALVHTRDVVDEICQITRMLNVNRDSIQQSSDLNANMWNNINWGENAPYWNQYYKVIREYNSPNEIKSEECRILDLVSEEISRLIDCQFDDDYSMDVNKFEIPIEHLMRVVSKITDDVEKVIDLLEWNGYEIVDNKVIHTRAVIDHMSMVSNEDWLDNDTSSEWESAPSEYENNIVPDYHARHLRRALDRKVRKLRMQLSVDQDVATELDQAVCRLMKLALRSRRYRRHPPSTRWLQCKLLDLLTLTEKAIDKKRKYFIEHYPLKAIGYDSGVKSPEMTALEKIKEDDTASKICTKYSHLVNSTGETDALDLADEYHYIDFDVDNITVVSTDLSKDSKYEVPINAIQAEAVPSLSDVFPLKEMEGSEAKLERTQAWLDEDMGIVPYQNQDSTDISSITSDTSAANVTEYYRKILQKHKSYPKSSFIDIKCIICKRSHTRCPINGSKYERKVNEKSSKSKCLNKKSNPKISRIRNKNLVSSAYRTYRTNKLKATEYKSLEPTPSKPIPSSIIEFCHTELQNLNNFENYNYSALNNLQTVYDVAATENCQIIEILTEDKMEIVALKRSIGTDADSDSLIEHETLVRSYSNNIDSIDKVDNDSLANVMADVNASVDDRIDHTICLIPNAKDTLDAVFNTMNNSLSNNIGGKFKSVASKKDVNLVAKTMETTCNLVSNRMDAPCNPNLNKWDTFQTSVSKEIDNYDFSVSNRIDNPDVSISSGQGTIEKKTDLVCTGVDAAFKQGPVITEHVQAQTIFLYDINEPTTSKGIRHCGMDVQCGPDVCPTPYAMSVTTSLTRIPKTFSTGLKIDQSYTGSKECSTSTMDADISTKTILPREKSIGIVIKDSDFDVSYKTESSTMTHDIVANVEEKMQRNEEKTQKSESFTETEMIKNVPSVSRTGYSSSEFCCSRGSSTNLKSSPIRNKNTNGKPMTGRNKLCCGGVQVHSYRSRQTSEDVLYQGKWQRATSQPNKKRPITSAIKKKNEARVNSSKMLKKKISPLNVKKPVKRVFNIEMKPPLHKYTVQTSIPNDKQVKIVDKVIKTKIKEKKPSNVTKVSSRPPSCHKTIKNTNNTKYPKPPFVYKKPPPLTNLTIAKEEKQPLVKRFGKTPDYLKKTQYKKPSPNTSKKTLLSKPSHVKPEKRATKPAPIKVNDIAADLLKFQGSVSGLNYLVQRNEIERKSSESDERDIKNIDNELMKKKDICNTRNLSPASANSSTCSSNSVATVRAVKPKNASGRRFKPPYKINPVNSESDSTPPLKVTQKKFIKRSKPGKPNSDDKSFDNKENIPQSSKQYTKRNDKLPKSPFLGSNNVFIAQLTETHSSHPTPMQQKSNINMPKTDKQTNLAKKTSSDSLVSKKCSKSVVKSHDLVTAGTASQSDDKPNMVIVLQKATDSLASSPKLNSNLIHNNRLVTDWIDNSNNSFFKSNNVASSMKELIEETLDFIDDPGEVSYSIDTETVILSNENLNISDCLKGVESYNTVLSPDDSMNILLHSNLLEAMNRSFNMSLAGESFLSLEPNIVPADYDMISCKSFSSADFMTADNESVVSQIKLPVKTDIPMCNLFDRKEKMGQNLSGSVDSQVFSGLSIVGVPIREQPDPINSIDSETGSLAVNRLITSDEQFVSGRSSGSFQSCMMDDDAVVPHWLFQIINNQQTHAISDLEDFQELQPPVQLIVPIPIDEDMLDANGNIVEGVGVGAGAGDGRGIHSDNSQDSSGRETSSSETSSGPPSEHALILETSAFGAQFELMREPGEDSGVVLTVSSNNELRPRQPYQIGSRSFSHGESSRNPRLSTNTNSDFDADISSFDDDVASAYDPDFADPFDFNLRDLQ